MSVRMLDASVEYSGAPSCTIGNMEHVSLNAAFTIAVCLGMQGVGTQLSAMISRPSLNRVWHGRIQVPTKWRGRATPEVKSFDGLDRLPI